MARSLAITDGQDLVTVTPEERDVLVSEGLIEIDPATVGDATVKEPFSLDDVKETIVEMREPDVI